MKPKRILIGMIGDGFLALAVRFGVMEYVKEKTTVGCLERRRIAQDFIAESRTTMISRLKNAFHRRIGSSNPPVKRPHLYWPLLMDALFAAPVRAIKVEMVSLCLEKGADPNFPVDDYCPTIWSAWFLRLLVLSRRGSLSKQTYIEELRPYWPVTEKLIRHGADMSLRSLEKSTGTFAGSSAKTLYRILSVPERFDAPATQDEALTGTEIMPKACGRENCAQYFRRGDDEDLRWTSQILPARNGIPSHESLVKHKCEKGRPRRYAIDQVSVSISIAHISLAALARLFSSQIFPARI
ncbi:hypothetical protein BDP81DRAFT_512041 [Colletotrichum phormii]|uniref:Ankyrin repeat protein n=1 Tax=Colletotrichum phormii TaxID=359342 RepID=A0AAI9ZBS1_9PEZI|nr:uncharacterized protein BDP81DRAFT_512041 [Colletotrichum phormii]KAK1621506.1 hypothetical protein BDP81DRAFT_512041 [Colletotrichum phormii]